MTTKDSRARGEEQIRERIDSWAKALRAKDLQGVLSHYAPDIRSFDLAPPLEHRGGAVRDTLAEWLPTWDGPIGYDIRDLSVIACDDVGFSHSLNHLTGKRTSGEKTDVWFRSTVCFRKIDGEWMAVHDHTSVPFYMDGSFRAAVDLRP